MQCVMIRLMRWWYNIIPSLSGHWTHWTGVHEAYVSGSWHRVPGSQSVLSCITINNTDCCSSSQHCPPSDRVQQSKVQLLIISSMLSEVSTVSHVRNMNLILVCVGQVLNNNNEKAVRTLCYQSMQYFVSFLSMLHIYVAAFNNLNFWF